MKAVPASKSVGGSFDLIDHDGNAVTDRTYHGRFMLVFFGFTHCRSTCPAVLARLSDAIARSGVPAERLQPLYITVDPERDAPAVMKNFLEGRYPLFRGLTGPRERLDEVKRAYRVFAKKVPNPEDPDGYDVPHSALSYLLGPDGEFVAHFSDSFDAETLGLALRSRIQV